jgi:hypothetical protein
VDYRPQQGFWDNGLAKTLIKEQSSENFSSMKTVRQKIILKEGSHECFLEKIFKKGPSPVLGKSRPNT